MAATVDFAETRLALTGLSGYSAGWGNVGDILDFVHNRAGRTALALGVLTGSLTGAALSAGRMEQTRIGFTTLLGGAEAARAKIEELQDFAARTPFAFEDVAKGSQMLLGAGTDVGKLIPVQQALGNIISANGRSSEDFGEALRQISQIISSGKLQGDELRILSERGLPRAELIRELGKTTGATADEFVAALIRIGNSSRYAGAMEAQSRTLLGSLSNLSDAGARLAIGFGEPLIAPLTGLTQAATTLAGVVEATPGPIRALAVGALGLWATKSLVATIQTTALIPKLVQEMHAHYGAAAGANAHAAALTKLSASGFTQNAAANTLLAAGTARPTLHPALVAAAYGRDLPVPFMTRARSFMTGRGGAALLAGGAGLGLMSLAGENQTGHAAGGILAGAGMGASVGSLGGPMGMVMGGLAGGIASGIALLIEQEVAKQGKDGSKAADSPEVVELRKVVERQGETIAALKDLRSGQAVSGSIFPGGQQVALATMDRILP